MRDGQHAIVKSVGLDTQFDVSGWTLSEKFRIAKISGGNLTVRPIAVDQAAVLAFAYGGPGGNLELRLRFPARPVDRQPDHPERQRLADLGDRCSTPISRAWTTSPTTSAPAASGRLARRPDDDGRLLCVVAGL
ncbi:hypothetical protein ACRAWD_07160 [Caulobacter segnis]